MSNIPKLKKRMDRRNINIVIDREVDDLYREAKQNGYDSSEIARQAVEQAFLKIKDLIKRPAS